MFYGLLSFPFLIFSVPLLNTILTKSRPTGYDKFFLFINLILLKKIWEMSAYNIIIYSITIEKDFIIVSRTG